MWEPLPAGVTWKCPALFNLPLRREAVVRALGEPHLKDLDSNGVGLFDFWGLRFPCGLEVAVWLFEDPDLPHPVEINANERDLDHIRFHLPLPAADLSRWPGTLIEAPRDWLVLRQDDGGNRYEVGAFTSGCEARDCARTFEERGHKQMYWVERRGA